MKLARSLTILGLVLAPLSGFSAVGGLNLLDSHTNLGDKAALQRGAQLFVNYCLSCHSLKYMRYKRMGEDLGISEKQIADNLMFASDKVVDQMTVAMTPEAGKKWFGVAPPDLSVIARSRGPDWLYSYLVTFYSDEDPSRRFGVNNVVYRDVGMPHAMWELQGNVRYVQGEVPEGTESVRPVRLESVGDEIRIINTVTSADGGHGRSVDTLVTEQPGKMAPGEFRRAMRDLVSFLTYVGEPLQLERHRLGFWVLTFLLFFCFLSYLLYKEYWKDLH